VLVILGFLAVTLTAACVAAALRVMSLPRARMAARMGELDAYGYVADAPPPAGGVAEAGPAGGPVTAVARRLGDALAERMGAFGEDELRRLLVAAGMYRTGPRTLLGYRALAAIVAGGLGVLAGQTIVARLALGSFGVLVGWVLTLTVLRRIAARRAAEIERAVPDLIDHIVVTLEAGIGFAASLQVCAARLSGPLGDEMRLALQEQRMGVTLDRALSNLRDRVESPNLRSFVRAVVQGERLGVSIGQVMRDLAVDMRKRRRQLAEERAQKTPVKLLLPIVFLILPTLLLVVLGPPMLDLMHGF
jgi:tight adherence protein C